MTLFTYAGIGARRTPEPVRDIMERFARYLAHQGWHLRTGGAEGADRAFARGTLPARRTIFLPWPRFNGWSTPDGYALSAKDCSMLHPIAAPHHPAWKRCSAAVRKLHARNTAILLGPGADDPVDAVICWTEGGVVAGGTGMAIRIARHHEIPVFNLAEIHPRTACEHMNRIAAGAIVSQLGGPARAKRRGE